MEYMLGDEKVTVSYDEGEEKLFVDLGEGIYFSAQKTPDGSRVLTLHIGKSTISKERKVIDRLPKGVAANLEIDPQGLVNEINVVF